jgi:hypothetical protein
LGRMEDPDKVIKYKLSKMFSGITPTGPCPIRAKEWHRKDFRASLVWFDNAYMEFSSIPNIYKDAHHAVPRIVFSHAIMNSKLGVI